MSATTNGISPVATGLPNLRQMQLNAIVLAERSKRPFFEGWPELATTDPAVHERWIRDYPDANVGAVLGLQPCNVTVFVVDLDVIEDESGRAGWDSLNEYRLARQLDPLPRTFTVRTGGGGVQCYFYAPADLEVPNSTALLAGVDVKGDRGQCVFPPSIHPDTGLPYKVQDMSPIAAAPTWLLELAGAHPRSSPPPSSLVNRMPPDELTQIMLVDGAPGGQRDELFRDYTWRLARTPGMTYREAQLLVRAAWQLSDQSYPGEPFTEGDAVAKLDRAWEKNERPSPAQMDWVNHVAERQEIRPEVAQRVIQLHNEQEAHDLFEEMQREPLLRERQKRTAREFVKLPQVQAVIHMVLAAEVNVLGGPQEAGKSLLARDWALCVATGERWRDLYLPPEVRNVLWIASEGLHDFGERWQSQPLWDRAAGRVFVLDTPIDLVRGRDVDWLLEEYRRERPGLVVFDVIYGMGMADDTGVRDVLPVLLALKRISSEWGAATLALGHPGHNGERRLRGSSIWRQLAYTDWHLAEGWLTCEKSKLTDRRRLGGRLAVEYPALRWLGATEVMTDEAGRWAAVEQDLREHPDASDRDRARRLGPALGVSEKTIRRLVKAVRDADTQGSAGS